jgi:hypothetical protein
VTTYIDPTTELPQNLADIYSDRNIRIVGQARINPNPLNPNQIDTIGIQVLCTPVFGGSEGVSTLPNATYTLSGAGSSLWVKITRAGTVTVAPEIYAVGTQPKSRKDYVQVFYQTSASQIVSISSFLIYTGPLYTRLGYGVGQRIYDAIVGNSGDDHVTHTDLQTAINETPNNGWILVKKMCLVTTPLNTNSKSIKFVFQGYGTGLQANGATTGITFQAAGCQMVGFGQVTGFSTSGIDLNNQIGSRIEMVFSGNTANINLGTLTAAQYNIQGSYGLSENSHITTSTTDGAVSRWNNTSKRWEPVPNITIDGANKITSTGQIQTTNSTASSNTTTGAVIVTGGAGVGGTVNVGGNINATSGTITGNIVIGAVYN